ncbi:MAG: type II secretion system protein [bacterium]|nr:type II secretion system protein [bacterium]
MKYYSHKAGFTVLELLVVISLMSLLFSAIYTAINSSREKTRDIVRVQAFSQLEIALSLYYDKYGVYPCGDNNGRYDSTISKPFINGAEEGDPKCTGGPKTGLFDEGFITEEWIKDPINSQPDGWSYFYQLPDVTAYDHRGSYVLYTRLEDKPDMMKRDGGKCDNFYEVGPDAGVVDLIFVELGFFGVSCN